SVDIAAHRQAVMSVGSKARVSGPQTRTRASSGGLVPRRLAQAIAAQAVLARNRHRQSRGFRGTPAIPVGIAGKFRPATGAGETAQGFCPIVHDGTLREAVPIFMPDSFRTAV